MQRWVLFCGWLVQVCNIFYAVVYVLVMIVFLVWLFVWYWLQYWLVCNVLVIIMVVCLFGYLVMVVLSWLLFGVGFVDMVLKYYQFVYGLFGAGVLDQLVVMLLVYVLWVVLVGMVGVWVGCFCWWWLVVFYLLVMMIVVVVMVNYYWFDGLVVIVFIFLVWWVQDWVICWWDWCWGVLCYVDFGLLGVELGIKLEH